MKTKLILLVILLFSWNAFAKAETVETELPVYTDAKPAIMLNQEKAEFVLKLKSNPATGFSWFLRDYDDRLMKPVKHRLITSSDKKLIGEPSYELWTFRMKPNAFIVPQQTLIRLTYARPWVTDNNSTQVIFVVSTGTE
jgi:inhibitor of cysteine peptidase